MAASLLTHNRLLGHAFRCKIINEMPSTILSFKVDPVVIIVLCKKKTKEFQAGLQLKEQKSRKLLKSSKMREVAYACRYASRHLIHNSVTVID